MDSRSSSDGSEAAATEMMMNPPSLASSSEMIEDARPSSRHSSTSFEVEVKPNKFELNAPRYTTWASPAKLKQEPMYTDETPTLTATVVPKVFSNGSPTSTSSNSAATPSSSHTPLPSSDRLTTSPAAIIQQTSIQVRPSLTLNGGHRLAEALRPPPTTSSVVSLASQTHLPLAAAAAAVKLQAMHPNLVSSSANHSHSVASLGSLQPASLHQHHTQPILRMVTPPTQFKPSPPKPSLESPSQTTAPIPVSSSSAALVKTPSSDGLTGTNNGGPPGNRKNGPSVILGEHGGVKTMIWTDSTTYWQTANKYRNLQVLPSQQQPLPQQQQQPHQPPPPGPSPTAMPPQALRHQTPIGHPPTPIHLPLGAQHPPPVPSLPPGSRALLLPPVTASPMAVSGPPTSLALKVEKPADHEQQLKMSSAVDGLLSLSSQGAGGRPSYPHHVLASSVAPPQMVQISPVHLSQGSNHPSPASTPARLSNSSVSSSPVPEISGNGLNPSPSPFNQNTQQPPPRRRSPMNMERLWAGDMSQLPSHVLESQNGHSNAAGFRPPLDQEEEEPLLCNICEDRATGLHYGIITCEGCKGFFKRTVQNKRVYSCVADGNCEINKAQRNRCQFCRFQKCLQQGMVLAAVREDRMPGGRNSGAVYNMYKVKYKKHKRANNTNGKPSSNPNTPGPPQPPSSTSLIDPFRRPKSESSGGLGNVIDTKYIVSTSPTITHVPSITTLPPVTSPAPMEMYTNPNKGLLGGVNILRAALTGSNDIPQQYKNLGRQSKEKYEEHHAKLIDELIKCDDFDDIATLRNIGELLRSGRSDLEDKLERIGDSIVHKLIEWVTRLPFYNQLPKEVLTKLLTHKWHELLVLTTSAYQAIHGDGRIGTTRTDGETVELHQEVATNLVTLQTCLTSMMGQPITMDQLRQDVGNMVEKITKVIATFRQFQLKMEEYVCLKVIAMVSQDDVDNPTLDVIHEKYLTCLRTFAKKHFPNQPNRVEELLVRLPEVQVAASLLLESKMFYVPFLLNSTID